MRRLGKYRLLQFIASGGMADVFRAEMPGADGFVKQVALKLIRGEHGESSDFVRMFIEEARLASRLTHANIVQVFEFDRIEGRHYIAMEYVHGRSLRQVLDRCRELGVKLDLVRSVHVCAEIAKALAYAHRVVGETGSQGIVHRDVSPPNVLVSFEGEVKLADFGIARAMGRVGLTTPGTIKGKAAYMAPEQARGESVDLRADVFSLAVVLWELCCGRRLFARDSDAATLSALIGDTYISPPSSWNEAVPVELDRVIMAALERDVERRTRSAEELANELGAVLLKLAKSPVDLDLRVFMHRLWPQATITHPRPLDEPTVPRPIEECGIVEGDEDAPTRTAVPLAPGRHRVLGAALAGVGLAVALGAGVVHRGRTEAVSGLASPVATVPVLESETTIPASLPMFSPSPAPAEGIRPLSQAPLETTARTSIVIATRGGVSTLPLPDPESGEGILSLNAVPWGSIYVDGWEAGHTPREVRLRAGAYRVRIVHPTHGSWVRTMVVKPGKRSSAIARLE